MIKNIEKTTSIISLFDGRLDCHVMERLIVKFQQRVSFREMLNPLLC